MYSRRHEMDRMAVALDFRREIVDVIYLPVPRSKVSIRSVQGLSRRLPYNYEWSALSVYETEKNGATGGADMLWGDSRQTTGVVRDHCPNKKGHASHFKRSFCDSSGAVFYRARDARWD